MYVRTYIHAYIFVYIEAYILTQKLLQNKTKYSRPTMTKKIFLLI